MCFVKHIVIQMRRKVCASQFYARYVFLPSFFNLSCLPIYVTFSFRRSFIINSKIYMQEMVKCYVRITHLHRPNRIRIQIQWEHVITCPRITEHTGHALETEIVARVFPPVAEDDNELCHLWHLKPLLLLYNTIQSSHVCSMVESRVLQIQVNLKKNKHTRQIPDGNKIESPYTKNHIHMQIITSFANFTQLYRFSYCDIRFNSKFDTVFGFVLKFYAKWYNIVSDMTVISK